MAIKQENERITITITPHEKLILQDILRITKRKTYTSAFRTLIKEYELRLKALAEEFEWEEVKINK